MYEHGEGNYGLIKTATGECAPPLQRAVRGGCKGHYRRAVEGGRYLGRTPPALYFLRRTNPRPAVAILARPGVGREGSPGKHFGLYFTGFFARRGSLSGWLR